MDSQTKKYIGVRRIKANYGLKDLYEHYKSTSPEKLLNYKEFKNVIEEFSKGLMESVILESETVKLPGRLGFIRVKKSKLSLTKNKLKIDWAKTKKYGKRIYHLNEHRNGHKYRFYWEKSTNVKNITYYSFTPTRTNKRYLASILQNKPEIDYYE